MEWVETTGRTVEDAKEAALDELGVDEADAEFEVLAEAQTGLFGRLRSEARVRARVKPTAPRSKDDRRDRRRRNGRSQSTASGTSAGRASGGRSPRSATGERDADGTGPDEPAPTPSGTGSGDSADDAQDQSARRRRRRPRSRTRSETPGGAPLDVSGATDDSPLTKAPEATAKGTDVEVALEEQADIAKEFLTELTAEFGLEATVAINRSDDDTVELQLTGGDLGILIGPKGATLVAIQNLTRTVVYNETGANNGHINVDVGGYRQKRAEALARFATQVANTVKQTGQRTAMEPMSSIDRKVVHDTITGIDGVSTISEGEEPRRRVVVLPD
ncbi:MAG: Jag N-terminal domain-containing protein [Acidimicrobiales bacterium]|nr:Jag N-terminal domain-containing protein [Acidimicrobiales bacterium]